MEACWPSGFTYFFHDYVAKDAFPGAFEALGGEKGKTLPKKTMKKKSKGPPKKTIMMSTLNSTLGGSHDGDDEAEEPEEPEEQEPEAEDEEEPEKDEEDEP